MDATTEQERLRLEVARHIERRSEAITEQWIEKVKELRGPSAFRRLSADEARDHIPGLVASIADDIREGELSASLEKSLDYLRLHVETRRDQGYDVREVLDEFQVLPVVVGWEVRSSLGATEDDRVGNVARIFELAYGKLGQVGAAASRVFAEGQIAEREQLIHRLGEFARTLEHEIRNPLNTAVVSAELLRREEIAGKPALRSEYVDRLQSELQQVKELLGEIRRLSIAEEGVLHEHLVPLREIVDQVFENLEEMAGVRGVELRVGVLPDTAWVRVPHVKLALRNLVANAIKYSDPEKEPRWASVSYRRAGDRFRLRVEDNGLGIPADQADRIFEAGVRAHPDAGVGSGLGLSIVREVLEQRGGSASVESREGEGSTFELDLPFPLSSDEEPVSAPRG